MRRRAAIIFSMPYAYLSDTGTETRLTLWPHRSLSRKGFVWFIGTTAALCAVPLMGVFGNPALWVLLPFVVAAIAGIWWALQQSYRDGKILEDLRITSELVSLTRHGPRGRLQEWQANPHWVRVTVHATGGPVPHYVTLRGNGREVEIGAFLSEEERQNLGLDLTRRLSVL